MFRSRSIKHARLLIRHAEKLIRYRCDVLTETALADIRHQIEAVERSIKQRDLPGVRENSERLDALVAEHSPSHREAGWRENCEVILVAIVVAVGVRSYFIQPFKIPTGSMQPTLNGIIGHPRTEPAPNILRQAAEFFIFGRNYINVVAPEMKVSGKSWSKSTFSSSLGRELLPTAGRIGSTLRRLSWHTISEWRRVLATSVDRLSRAAQSILVIRYSWISSAIIS